MSHNTTTPSCTIEELLNNHDEWSEALPTTNYDSNDDDDDITSLLNTFKSCPAIYEDDEDDDENNGNPRNNATMALHELIHDGEWSDVSSILNSPDIDALVTQLATPHPPDMRNALHSSILHGAPLPIISKITSLLPTTTTDKHGQTPLHLAGTQKSTPLDILQLLLSSYPTDVKMTDDEGQLPLHCALIEERPWDVIKLLIEAYPAGVRMTDDEGNLPLHWAFYDGVDGATMTGLLDLSEDKDCRCAAIANKDGRLPLHRFCVNEASVELIQRLIDVYPEGCRHFDREGNLPHHLVCQKSGRGRTNETAETDDDDDNGVADDGRSCEILELLLASHPSGALATNSYGELPLHRAVAKNAPVGIVSSLVEIHPEGAATTIASSSCDGGSLPLHLACTFDASIDVVNILLTHYPDGAKMVDAMGGCLPLHRAIINFASRSVIARLVEVYKEGVSRQDDGGKTPLHYACLVRREVEVVRVLVDGDVGREAVTVRDGEGRLAIHYAWKACAPVGVLRLLWEIYPESGEMEVGEDGKLKNYIEKRMEEEKDDEVKGDMGCGERLGGDGGVGEYEDKDKVISFSDDFL